MHDKTGSVVQLADDEEEEGAHGTANEKTLLSADVFSSHRPNVMRQ